MDLASLAKFLYELVPHAAGTERCFSVMSWYHSKARNRMLTRTVAMMTTIKAHLDAERQT